MILEHVGDGSDCTPIGGADLEDMEISRKDIERHRIVGQVDVAFGVLQGTTLLHVALDTPHEAMEHAEHSFHHDSQDSSIRTLDDARLPSISDSLNSRTQDRLPRNYRMCFPCNFLMALDKPQEGSDSVNCKDDLI